MSTTKKRPKRAKNPYRGHTPRHCLPRPGSEPRVVLAARYTQTDAAELQAAASERGITVSDLIRVLTTGHADLGAVVDEALAKVWARETA